MKDVVASISGRNENPHCNQTHKLVSSFYTIQCFSFFFPTYRIDTVDTGKPNRLIVSLKLSNSLGIRAVFNKGDGRQRSFRVNPAPCSVNGDDATVHRKKKPSFDALDTC